MARTNQTRCNPRRRADSQFTVTWQDQHGNTISIPARGVDISASGARVEIAQAIESGASVYIQSEKYNLAGPASVRHCTRRGAVHLIGLEFTTETKQAVRLPSEDFVDYYEILQISPNAEAETIHRVFRIMASRFHPDNPETGDKERFLLLTRAYQVLSDIEKRTAYDLIYHTREEDPLPVFELKEFVDDIEGEANRRLGVLCLLYNQRRNSPEQPGLSVLQLEKLMSFPREHLAFTLWYLKDKRYVRLEDNSDYALTADGVDYVETRMPANNIVQKLLRAGTDSHGSTPAEPHVAKIQQLIPPSNPEPAASDTTFRH